jgi:hypothetical protein
MGGVRARVASSALEDRPVAGQASKTASNRQHSEYAA